MTSTFHLLLFLALLVVHPLEAREGESGSSSQEGGKSVVAFGDQLGKQADKSSDDAMLPGEDKESVQKEDFSKVDVSESFMLLGGISFVMIMFYLVNHEDADMKYYSWLVISATVSIFAAVLIYSGVKLAVRSFLLPHCFGADNRASSLFSVIEILLYYMILQVGTAFEAGALYTSPIPDKKKEEQRHTQSWLDWLKGESPIDEETRKYIELYQRRMERRTKGWASIFAHVTGFACIHCGDALLQMSIFEGRQLLTFIVPALMFLSCITLNAIAGSIRKLVLAGVSGVYERLSITDSDGESAQTSAEIRSWTQELWKENVIDAEHDAASIAVSFLIVQACRYSISGVMPTVRVEVEPSEKFACSYELFALAVVFAVLTSVMVCFLRRCTVRGNDESCRFIVRRAILVMQNSMAMAFAWSMLYAAKWVSSTPRMTSFLGSPNTISSRIVLALAISLFAFVLTRALDLIVDMESTGEDADEALFSLIMALGLLVGFSWEQAFDAGLEAISTETAHPRLMQLGLAIFVVLLILPAWRRHILQKVLDLQHARDDQKSKKAKSRSLSIAAEDQRDQE